MTTTRFPLFIFLFKQRVGHRAFELGGRIYALGGDDENSRLLPMDHFSVFNPWKSWWSRQEIRGDEIPRRDYFSVGVIDQELLVFGGGDEGLNPLNDLYYVDLTSFVCKQLNPQGEAPSPRSSCLHWVWEKKLFVLGGRTKR